MVKNDNNNNNNNNNDKNKISYTLSPLEDVNFFASLIIVRLFTYEVKSLLIT